MGCLPCESVESEFELIAKLRARLEAGAGGDGARIVTASGDDAAVTVPGGATATSVDMLVEGVHFRRQTASLRSVGHKAMAAALSDLAAMGAEPGEAYVQLGIPADLDEAGCLELADGMAEPARAAGVAVLGGNVSRAPVLVVAMTVVGHAAAEDALVTRAGAEVGDAVCVTGELGAAAAGLLLLERPELASGIDVGLAGALRARQLEPEPPLGAGRALAGAGASAMIDISDGLGADAGHVARAGGVRLELELERVPVAPGVAEVAVAAGLDPAELATAGGEDYELLVTLAPPTLAAAMAACEAAGARLTEIGRVRPGEGVLIRRADGSAIAPGGFDQLRATPPTGGAPS